MQRENDKKLILPALRGSMGVWIYYACLMNFKEISDRIDFPQDLHQSEQLSDMIQRILEKDRGKEIAEYIITQKERFFNSLVVATYGGEPRWYGLEEYSNEYIADDVRNLVNKEVDSLGFLELTGEEKIFTVDGQHRLAGIKRAIINEKKDLGDRIPVIFLGHNKTTEGLQKMRRLFTVLNKKAKPVSKNDIIALDEDDVMAITTRRLIEGHGKIFDGKRLEYSGSNNISAKNLDCLTTIGNLYDILNDLFTEYCKELNPNATKRYEIYKLLQNDRPDDNVLEEYFKFAKRFFKLLRNNFNEIDDFFSKGENFPDVTKKYRGEHGGSILFRPIGLSVFTRIITLLNFRKLKGIDMTLEQSVKLAAKLPRDLNQEPYVNLIWDPARKRIMTSKNALLREVLLDMLGGRSQYSEQYSGNKEMLKRYREATGNPEIELPKRVVQK